MLLRVFFLLFVLPLVHATIFVTAPLDTTTCHGGQSCQVQWVDNGETPFLTTIGPCYVGLFNGNGVLVQQIEPVDVSSVHSLQFTPDPSAGPSSHGYYINFTSVNAIGNDSTHYTQYSPFFALTGMTGSLQSPIPSDTSALPVPSTVASAPSNSVTTTISVINTFSSHSSSVASSVSGISASSTSSSSTTASSSQSGTVSESSSLSSSSSPGSSTLTVPPTSSPTSSGSSSFITSRMTSSIPSTSSASTSSSASTTSATSGASRSVMTGFASSFLLLLSGMGAIVASVLF